MTSFYKKKFAVLTSITLLLGCLIFNNSNAQTVEESLQKIAEQLSLGITKNGKKRVAVTNFLDLQNNVTELGRFLAESFSMELVNSSTVLEVVDRSQINNLLQELKMSEEKLLDPGNATKLGKMAGVEVIVTGTISALDNAVYVTTKAIDIQRGIIIAARQGTIPRTDAVNALLRSTVDIEGNIGGKPSIVTTMPRVNNTTNAINEINQIKVTPLNESICKKQNGAYYGYVCFESQLPSDVILYRVTGDYNMHVPNTLLSSNGRGCSPLLRTSSYYPTNMGSVEITFKFKTTSEPILYGQYITLAEGCVTKSVVLHPGNIALRKDQN